MPQELDPEGFDPTADTGAGIYSGREKKDAKGKIVMGRQYIDHNPEPGPAFSGGGFTDMAHAIHSGPQAVRKLLAKDPSLAHEIATGGATPLHTSGMSRTGQLGTQTLIEAGGWGHHWDNRRRCSI
jgi:hypothetical protein